MVNFLEYFFRKMKGTKKGIIKIVISRSNDPQPNSLENFFC